MGDRNIDLPAIIHPRLPHPRLCYLMPLGNMRAWGWIFVGKQQSPLWSRQLPLLLLPPRQMRMAEVAGKAHLPANAATWTIAPAVFTAIRAVAASAVVVMTPCPSALASDPVIDRASVIDGDTIEIAGERIRFNGIDAPEGWQTRRDGAGKEYRCGKASAEALDAFLAASRPTRCEYVERDRYRRFVGNCYRADGKSVALWLVRNGWALDWPRYSKGAYAAEQEAARTERSGMWRGEFAEPWNARRTR